MVSLFAQFSFVDFAFIVVWLFLAGRGLRVSLEAKIQHFMHVCDLYFLFVCLFVCLCETENYLACQSMDNQILLYSTKDRFRLNRKKRFVGHTNAGYAIQINFSPDGRFIMSGDGDGKLWFWDFKSSRVLT
jgi:WD40 repeat protein